LKSFGSTSCFSSSFPGLRLAHGNDFPPGSGTRRAVCFTCAR
jgi:hypothetical protein